MFQLLVRPAAALLMLFVGLISPAAAQFDMVVTISNPTSFTPVQLQILEKAVDRAEFAWERVITGYQPGINITQMPISIFGQTSGFANASVTGSTNQGGYNLSTSGRVNINRLILEEFSNFEVDEEVAEFPGQRANVIDELVAHEIGHVLGIGTKWSQIQNGVRPYTNGTGRYVGEHGLRAYRKEFNLPDAEFVPVELAGSSGSANTHWDQCFRSQEDCFDPAHGDPGDPFEEDPRLGIVDDHGRDFGLAVMSAAVDPDWGDPFLTLTTIHALRDLGFTTVPEPATAGLLIAAGAGILFSCRR